MFDHVFMPFVCLGTGQTIVSGAEMYTCFMPFEAAVLSEGFFANATYEVGTHIHSENVTKLAQILLYVY